MQDLHLSQNASCNFPADDAQHQLASSKSIGWWLEAAARLPGRAMHVAVVLRRLATVERSDQATLSNRACDRLGMNRSAKYRALRSLEGAGLIRVQRKLGQSPVVLIVHDPGPQ